MAPTAPSEIAETLLAAVRPHFVKALQERRLKYVDGVHIEIVEDAGQDDPPHGGQFQYGAKWRLNRGARGDGSGRIEGPAHGFWNPQRQPGEQQSGQAGEQECRPPAECGADGAGAEIRQAYPGGKPEHEYAHGARSLMRRKQIADQRLAGGRARGFAQAHTQPGNEELRRSFARARRRR